MLCMDKLLEGLYRRLGGLDKLTSVAGYVAIFSWSCDTLVGPGSAQPGRHYFHLNKEAFVAVCGAFSITQGIMGISIHRVTGSAPVKPSVSVSTPPEGASLLAQTFGLSLRVAYAKSPQVRHLLSIWSRDSQK